MAISVFQCPRCRAVLQVSAEPQPQIIVRCMQCEFIFPTELPGWTSSGFPETEVSFTQEVGQIYAGYPGPTSWVDWKTSETISDHPKPASPISQPDSIPYVRPRRFRPRRPAFPWTMLIVGILVGLALLGSIVVLIVALWLKK